ncbi:GNAT family N-acetyltransferase [Blastopirellula sp. JC732]|uniref:GNAT family N-acetyltransferase n=1 Tax=Blastopirellula sediminis TaxID=2894196 RepID=A0A9X1MTF5_9BACT|nr:GNAT family N-acetyltransferase [Blastopirellula sediminis]MCC9604539.1 GNAT family N-acetyltransferase [Blastopirellula sediminis]MCC9632162.1 GNAT family N-acetyltransferase [Blastopirellula sediminis]
MDFRFLAPDEASRLRNVPSDLFDGALNTRLLEQFLADPRNHLCVVFVEGIAIGYASGVHLTRVNQADEFFIYEVEVTSAWRDAGVAQELLKQLLAKAVELNCETASAVARQADPKTIDRYRAVGGFSSYDVLKFSFPLVELVQPLQPTEIERRKSTLQPVPHPSPVKALNVLLTLHMSDKSGDPPGEKLTQQIAAEFLPEDEMEVTLQKWREVGWSWTFSIDERKYEGVLAILAEPRQALLQMGPLDRITFFGMQPKLSLEDMEPLRERTLQVLEKLPEVASVQFSADGFPDALIAPDPKSIARAMKKWDDSRETGMRRPVEGELNLLYRFLLSPLRTRRGRDAEPIRRVDVVCLNALIVFTIIGRIYLFTFFPWPEQLWLVPLYTVIIGGALTGFRKRIAWIAVSVLTTATFYFSLALLRGMIHLI